MKALSPALVASIYYEVATLLTLALYAWDKHAARSGAARVRERTLHLLALVGGFAGALAGQGLLRHKSLHPSFALIAWFALAAHAAVWVWWLNRSGAF